MKVYSINSFGNLSTGTIATDITRMVNQTGNEGRMAYARGKIADDVSSYHIGNVLGLYTHGILSRLTDKTGEYSICATKKLLQDISDFKPDIIHLHNLHGYYVNVEMLMNYIDKNNIPVVWTLHDCWTMTGHCCHFTAFGCDKWKTGCHDCMNIKSYPESFVDNSNNNYKKKKIMFTKYNFTYVTVSKWLEGIAKESYLKKNNILTIYNGIDMNIFKPVQSELRKKYNLEHKRIILGVASTWTQTKGLNDFILLSKIIPIEYKIVLIGLSKKQLSRIPQTILGFPRTETVQELVEWYSVADIYLNTSVEETFGMPTLEAIACGTPVIVYNTTALPEIVEKGCGCISQPHDIKMVLNNINEILNESVSIESLRTIAEKYKKEKVYKEYIELYEKIYKGGAWISPIYCICHKIILAVILYTIYCVHSYYSREGMTV